MITLDDATGEIYSAFLVDEEGGVHLPGAARGLRSAWPAVQPLHRSGQPLYLLTCERGEWGLLTPKAGEKPDPKARTQVGRALAQLGIEHIGAYSPEARARCERAFRTLQDRLPKELSLAGITGIEAANRFFREVYLPAHNARFAQPAEEEGSAFVAVDPELLKDILSIQEERVVGNDNTVDYGRRRLQIPPGPLRPYCVRAKVRSTIIPTARLPSSTGPPCLARYGADGSPQEHTQGRRDPLPPSSRVDKILCG